MSGYGAGEPMSDYAEDGPTRADARASLEREARRAKDSRAPVERELDRIQEAVSETDTIIGELGRRLSAVLGPERPEPALGEVRQTEDLSPLTGRMMEEADRLVTLNGALRSLLRRIEL